VLELSALLAGEEEVVGEGNSGRQMRETRIDGESGRRKPFAALGPVEDGATAEKVLKIHKHRPIAGSDRNGEDEPKADAPILEGRQ
jgi:hypothetical protein